jgi:hypothetical protein
MDKRALYCIMGPTIDIYCDGFVVMCCLLLGVVLV